MRSGDRVPCSSPGSPRPCPGASRRRGSSSLSARAWKRASCAAASPISRPRLRSWRVGSSRSSSRSSRSAAARRRSGPIAGTGCGRARSGGDRGEGIQGHEDARRRTRRGRMNFADMMEMLRNPQAMQARMTELREKTERMEAVGSSGGGMVRDYPQRRPRDALLRDLAGGRSRGRRGPPPGPRARRL